MTYNRIARAVRQGYIATIAAVLVVTATGVAARAATICVDPSGKHGCLTTIQAGVTAASAGDTVFVKTGKYFETVTVPSGKDGLILQGASKTGVVIIASYPDGIDVQSNNVTIETLSIETFYYWGIVVADGVSATTISKVRIQGQIYGGYACINNGGPNTTVTKSTLNGCYYGIYTTASVGVFDSTISQCSNGCIYATADSVAIVHNTINPYGGYGIYVSGDGPEVNDNTIGPVSSYAISVSCHDSGYTTCTAASIGGNKAPGQIGLTVTGSTPGVTTVADNKVTGTPGGASGFYLYGNGITVHKNKVTNASGSGFYLQGSNIAADKNSATGCYGNGFYLASSTAPALSNNTASNNLYEGFYLDGGTTGANLQNNSASGSLRSGFYLGSTGHTLTSNTASGSLIADFCGDTMANTLTTNKFKNINTNSCTSY